FQFQTYYDRAERVTALVDEDRDIFDVDFQHRMPLTDRHRLIWGAGYQTSRDHLIQDGYVFSSVPTARSINVMGFFVQDEIEVIEDELYFTVGSKFENNTFTQFEYQPSGRLVWTPNEREAYWGAVSRAIRRPSRINNDLRLRTLSPLTSPAGIHPLVLGNDNVVSEDLLAFEIGYRAQPTEYFSWDVTAFHNDYNDMSAPLLTVPFPPQLTFGAGQDGRSLGLEMTANYQINDCWRVYGSYTFFNLNIVTANGETARNEDADPSHQANLWLSGDLREDVQLDVMFRYVDAINVTGVAIPSYLEMDVRLGWQATDSLELALIGRNLLDDHHPEFLGEVFSGDIGTEVERSVYGVATWVY
ncbi:MAG TPA: TonB-dependent receptor, partial [Pirellulaceae bacterium]|nr:TonB-dependent receptor [Pirellulaceae bacterium]